MVRTAWSGADFQLSFAESADLDNQGAPGVLLLQIEPCHGWQIPPSLGFINVINNGKANVKADAVRRCSWASPIVSVLS